MTRQLAIIDPALGLSKGHHAGFYEMVVKSCPENINVEYFTNKAFDNSSRTTSISVNKVFSQDFYANYQKSTNAAEIIDYIMTLSKEFILVFQQIMTFNKDWIENHYLGLPEKINKLRQLLNRPITFTEKKLY